MNEILRIVLPLYLLAFFLIVFVWRSYLVWKRTGINPYAVGKEDNAINFIESIYSLTLALLVTVTIFFSFFPTLYQYAVPIFWLEYSYVKLAGLFLLIASLIWIAIAQMQMGESWRIGIDEKNATTLVEKGLFLVSRNPVFLGMRLALLGFFLVIPNSATLLIAFVNDILMQVQVRLEEVHLYQTHGDMYKRYCQRIRRWL